MIVCFTVLTAAAFALKLKITLAADNTWSLTLPSQTQRGDDWTKMDTFEEDLQGNGPWVIGVKTQNQANIAAFWASVYLEGQPFTSTGVASTQFEVSQVDHSDWLNPSFSSNDFKKNYFSQDCIENRDIWGNDRAFKDLTPSMEVHGTWFPNCMSPASDSINYYRLVIPAIKVPAPPDVQRTSSKVSVPIVADPQPDPDPQASTTSGDPSFVLPSSSSVTQSASTTTSSTTPSPSSSLGKSMGRKAPSDTNLQGSTTSDTSTDGTVSANISSSSPVGLGSFALAGIVAGCVVVLAVIGIAVFRLKARNNTFKVLLHDNRLSNTKGTTNLPRNKEELHRVRRVSR
jgi:hypothetical protein